MLHPPGLHVRQRSVGRYEPESKDEQAEEPLLDAVFTPTIVLTKRAGAVTLYALWAMTLVVTSIVTAVLTRRLTYQSLGAFDNGFETELYKARPHIQVLREQFTGSLDFKDRSGFIPPDSPSMKYIGATPDVDAAWMELVGDRYFLLSDEEADAAFGPNAARYWNVHHGGYAIGLDVLHTLHCVNQLRMSLYPEVYPQDPRHGVMHKAHCVDHLRQLAMCGSDLTPIPTQWFPGLGQNYINSSQEHTCRDFWRVREWATERFNGSTAVKPRNRDGSPREDFYAPWSP
ncbi:hypothetical protein BAUCODRAFT_151715 [Baudoinia panamericana UAMH 10762]|uniref:DUF3328 domain-containing protein n=1 Tax=Baudoinia panamericana (strain UAMH 10762) TaxID=717646 RepID=M2MLN2_BAUPA|nr:uncharacterized protein BAUCODRAFT_151715 [Baudoinia panamericana UAMH 10762]EMC92303.1 hypothetical protein BAUCODRAFT_151715 [Baudoinia panamericana UAMH 10762]